MIVNSQREFVDQVKTWIRMDVQSIHVAAGTQADLAEQLVWDAYRETRTKAGGPTPDGLNLVTWDMLNGLRSWDPADPRRQKGSMSGTVSFVKAVQTAIAPADGEAANLLGEDALVIFRDPHFELCHNPMAWSSVKEGVKANEFATKVVTVGRKTTNQRRVVVWLTNEQVLSPELVGYVKSIAVPLPVAPEIDAIIDRLTANWPDQAKRLTAAGSDTRRQARDALAGLGSRQIADVLSESVIEVDRDMKANRPPDLRATVEKNKADALRASETLTYESPASIAAAPDLKGYERLDEWVARRRVVYSPTADGLDLDMPKGLALVGIPGCVDGSTRLAYLRGKRAGSGGRFITVENMYRKLNGLPTSDGRTWDQSLDTYLHSFDAESGRVFYNKVLGVYEKGVKPCLTIKTDTHGDVTLTYDHPVLVEGGTFRPAGQLEVGDRLLVRGSMKPSPDGTPVERTKRSRVVVEGLKHYRSGWRHSVKDKTSGKVYEYQRTHRARLVFEAHMNGISYDQIVEILKTDPVRSETLKTLPDGWEVHHVDEDPTNDELTNLMLLTKAEHTGLHCDEERFDVEYTRTAVVTQIEPAGDRMTYDVSMDQPCCNFAVNDGVIVHNTGKSTAARRVARGLGLPLVRFDFSAVFGSLVGESERRTRETLQTVTAMRGCVLLVDEVDKALGGAHESSGDSGVTQRVFGNLLTWMAEKNDRSFVLFTMNRIDRLPPELLRRGRVDEVFFVDLPNDQCRRDILALHMSRRQVDPARYDASQWDDLVAATDMFVGAELEEVVKSARLLALSADPASRAVPTADQLLEVARQMVPLAKTDSTNISAIREFGSSRAVSVTADAPKVKAGRRRSSGVGARDIDLSGPAGNMYN